MTGIFDDNAIKYWRAGLSVIPLDGKSPVERGWTHHINGPAKAETQRDWLTKHGKRNFGVLTGGTLPGSDYKLVAIDGDDDNLVRVIEVIVGKTPCSKKGKKGRTDFLKYSKSWKLKSTQIRDARGHGKIDILGPGKQTVLPPSIHPETKLPYTWTAKSLLEVRSEDLPEFTED